MEEEERRGEERGLAHTRILRFRHTLHAADTVTRRALEGVGSASGLSSWSSTYPAAEREALDVLIRRSEAGFRS